MGGQFALLFLVHAVGDFYAGFFGPLVPRLMETFHLDQAGIGALQAITMVVANYAQPFIGWMGERVNRRAIVAGGVALSGAGMCLVGVAGGWTLLLIGLVLGGLGVGLFHPCGAALAGEMDPARRARGLAFYMSGGNFGLALAPLAVAAALHAGASWMMALAVPSLLVAAWAWLGLRRQSAERECSPRAPLRLGATFRALWPIHVQVVFRFIPISVIGAFVVKWAVLAGMGRLTAALTLSMFVLMGGFGSLLGGRLTRRLPGRSYEVLSETACGVMLLIAPVTRGPALFLLLGASAFLAYSVIPRQIAAAQELLPEARGAASGVVMGLAYGNAGLALLPLGWLGDRWTAAAQSRLIGVTREMQVSAVFFFLAAAVALWLRPRHDAAAHS